MVEHLRKTIKLALLLTAVPALLNAADNTLRVNKLEITQGALEVECPIYLDNNVSMCGFEVFVELPEGIKVKYEYDEDEEEYVWGVTKGGRVRTEHGVNCGIDTNGYVHLLCADLVTNKNFYDSETRKGLPLVTMTLVIDPKVSVGSYDVVLHDILLNHNENATITEYTPADRKSPLIVRPKTGVYSDVKNDALTFITAVNIPLSTTDYLQITSSYSDIPAIDVSGAVLDGNMRNTSDFLNENTSKNLLIYASEKSDITGNNVIVDDICDNFVLTDGNRFSAPKSFTAINATYAATVSPTLGYKTLVLPYNCDVPDGFEAYEVGSLTGNTLNMVKVLTITAGKPVILKNAGTAAMAAMNVTINATNGATLDNGMLEGTYSEMFAPVGSYVLQNIGGNVAFYPVAEGKQPKVGAFRAYLTAGTLQAKALNLNFDGTVTGIDAVEAETDVMTYNINGQRICNSSKGLVIVRSANGVVKRVK